MTNIIYRRIILGPTKRSTSIFNKEDNQFGPIMFDRLKHTKSNIEN